jgi:hypothetical protein
MMEMALSHIKNLAELEWNDGEWGITVHTVSTTGATTTVWEGENKSSFQIYIHEDI